MISRILRGSLRSVGQRTMSSSGRKYIIGRYFKLLLADIFQQMGQSLQPAPKKDFFVPQHFE